MRTNQITVAQFDNACDNLARFMHRKAQDIYRHTGISYVPMPGDKCPENGKAIVRVFDECRKACKAFPVFDGGSETAIYGAAANHAFRFWHDYLHYAHHATVGLQDELRLAELHRQGVAAVFGYNSLEARIMFADVAAQAMYYFSTGKFVDNQKGFIFAAIQSGEF